MIKSVNNYNWSKMEREELLASAVNLYKEKTRTVNYPKKGSTGMA